MRLNTERDAIEFALTRSSLPTGGSIYRGAIETELERLKERLLAEELARTVTLDVNVLLRRAANEAVALAWLTPVPCCCCRCCSRKRRWPHGKWPVARP